MLDVYQTALNLMMQNTQSLDLLETIIGYEEEHCKEEHYMGFEWYDVHAPSQALNRLVTKGILKIAFKSNKSCYYMLVDIEMVKKAIEAARLGLVNEVQDTEITIPDDLFSIIELHDDKKDILMRALKAEKPVHFLLVGVPGSAKSLFLMELTRLPSNAYALGSSLSKAGIYELMFDERPRYLIVDEIDKVDSYDNTTALLSLMETGILVETKYKRRREDTFKTWVFAGANYLSKISPELRNRFFTLTFREYSPDEFVIVSTNVLIKREKVSQPLAEHIAHKLLREVETRDVRDAVRVSRLAKTVDEVDRIVEIMKKNQTK